MRRGGRVEGRRRRRTFAIVFGLVAAVLLAEGLLRLTGIGWYEARRDTYAMISIPTPSGEPVFAFDPERPTSHAWDGDPYGTLPDGARIEYRDIHPDGVRGVPPADDGTPRVLFMGDSFTFGEGVLGDDTIAPVTQHLLAAEGVAIAALNAGVPGYGTHEERLRLPLLLERFRPSLVIVVFTPNDAIQLSEAHSRGHDLLRYVPERGTWRVTALLTRILSADERARATEQWYLSHYVGESRRAWGLARRDLYEMNDLTREAGAELAVAYFPLLHQLEEGPLDAIRDEVGVACERARIPFLDLGPGFAGLDERSLWVHPVDHHPNSRAHGLAARRLAPFVRGLLESR